MKLVRYGRAGREKPGLVDADGKLRDLSGKIDDITPDLLSPKCMAKLARYNPKRLPLVKGRPRLGVPWSPVGKIMCIGLNYVDHAKETGSPIPTEPILFIKANSALNGPNDTVIMPKGSKKSDWECEMGVVIGTAANNVTQKAALSHVAGYTICNDVSEREWQIERGGNWSKGKSGDGYGPIGPWLVTPDEIPDPQAMDLWLERNGKTMQSGSTADMVFPVTELIAYLSQCMSLNVGDIIATGTPAGVGLGRKPPVFLEDGDHLRLGITGLGEQSYRVFTDNES